MSLAPRSRSAFTIDNAVNALLGVFTTFTSSLRRRGTMAVT